MTLKEMIAEKLANKEITSEEAIDQIISGLGVYMVSKDQYNKKTGEINELQEAIKKAQLEKEESIKKLEEANLTAEELQKKKIDEIIANANKKEAEYKIKSNSLDATQIFANAGLKEDDYKEFLNPESKAYIITEDNEKTKSLASALVNTIANQKKLTEEEVTKRIQGNNPTPPAGDGGNDVMTKEKLNKMTYSEEMAFAKNNPELYAELLK